MINMYYLPKKYVGEDRPDYTVEKAPNKLTFKKCVVLAEKYNLNTENEYYVAKVSKITDDFTKSELLSYFAPLTKQPFKLSGKHNVLGSNAFDCDYLIPLD